MNETLDRPAKFFLKQSVSASVGVGALYSLSQATLRAKVVEIKKGVKLAIATICVDRLGDHLHEPTFRFVPELGLNNGESNLWHPGALTPSSIDGIKERCSRAGLNPISVQGMGFGIEGRNGVTKDLSRKMVLMVILQSHAIDVLEGTAGYQEIFAAIDPPNVGTCFDTGHLEGVNEDLIEVVDRFHEWILYVDLKVCKERGKSQDTVPLVEGVTDLQGFLSHLMATGYQGYLIVEQACSGPKEDCVNDFKTGLSALSSMGVLNELVNVEL